MALGAYAAIHLLNTLLGESSVLREGDRRHRRGGGRRGHLRRHHAVAARAGNPFDLAHLHPAARCLRVGETV